MCVCVCVCLSVCLSVCLCLSRCLSGRFKYEGLVPHKKYFAGTLLGMPNCASYVSRTHDDVTRSQSRSNFEIDISPSIFELERRSKAQNVGYVNGYLSDIFNFPYHFRLKKKFASSKWRPFWKFVKGRPKLCQKKVLFMMMTSSMTSQGGLKVGPLYSFLNEITFPWQLKNELRYHH